MKIEASVLLGDWDEEVEVHGESDSWFQFHKINFDTAKESHTMSTSRSSKNCRIALQAVLFLPLILLSFKAHALSIRNEVYATDCNVSQRRDSISLVWFEHGNGKFRKVSYQPGEEFIFDVDSFAERSERILFGYVWGTETYTISNNSLRLFSRFRGQTIIVQDGVNTSNGNPTPELKKCSPTSPLASSYAQVRAALASPQISNSVQAKPTQPSPHVQQPSRTAQTTISNASVNQLCNPNVHPDNWNRCYIDDQNVLRFRAVSNVMEARLARSASLADLKNSSFKFIFINGVIAYNGDKPIDREKYTEAERIRLAGDFAKANQMENEEERRSEQLVQEGVRERKLNDARNKQFCFDKRNIENKALVEFADAQSINSASVRLREMWLEGSFVSECKALFQHQRGLSTCTVTINQRGVISEISNCYTR